MNMTAAHLRVLSNFLEALTEATDNYHFRPTHYITFEYDGIAVDVVWNDTERRYELTDSR